MLKKSFTDNLLILVLIVMASHKVNGQTTVGIKAGANFSNLAIKKENVNAEAITPNIGSQFGVNVTVQIDNDFYIQPGFMIIDKGFKQSQNGFDRGLQNFQMNVTYLEIPVSFQYKLQLGLGKLILGIGGYAACGIGGVWKADNQLTVDDIVLDNYGKALFKNDVIDGEFGTITYGKRYDYGADLTIGYDFTNKLWVEINSQIGLANLQPNLDGVKQNGSLRNRSFALSIGYKF